MTDTEFHPFADDSSVAIVDGLSIENGLASIVLHGEFVIYRDAASLGKVRYLIETLRGIESSISLGHERISDAKGVVADEVANPFG